MLYRLAAVDNDGDANGNDADADGEDDDGPTAVTVDAAATEPRDRDWQGIFSSIWKVSLPFKMASSFLWRVERGYFEASIGLFIVVLVICYSKYRTFFGGGGEKQLRWGVLHQLERTVVHQ